MKKGIRIIGYVLVISVVVGMILLIAGMCIIGTQMGYSKKRYNESAQAEIVARIDSFIHIRGRLPELLSEVGFNQTIFCYENDEGCALSLIPSEKNTYYIRFYCNGNEFQYNSKRRKWASGNKLIYFEPPSNMDTLAQIAKIRESLGKLDSISIISFDSIRVNRDIGFPINDYISDSLVYVTYHKPNSMMRMEGWATFNENPRYNCEYGEWIYYDSQNNRYRKFWNYTKGNTLIYEAD